MLSFYEANKVKSNSTDGEKGIRVKLRLLDDHFYDDVNFSGTIEDLIAIIEKAKMLHIKKNNGDQIFINSRLIVDFVLS